MNRPKTKTVPVMIRMETELHERALESAGLAERTLSQEIRLALRTHLRAYQGDKGQCEKTP